MITRKQQRFCYLLLFCLLLQGNLSYAQEFDPVTPVETLVQEVSNGTASITQFEALKDFAAEQALNTEINDFLAQESTENYFDQTFKAEGFYGEKKNGVIIEDWEILAKGMGTTGGVLVGAYAVWRRRRQDYLARLRAGDGQLVEQLVSSPDFPKSGLTAEGWSEWAKEKGIPGAGVLLQNLYAIWARREDRSDDTFGEYEDFIREVYSDQEDFVPESEFMLAFREALLVKKNEEEAKLYNVFTQDNPEPVYPETPVHLSALGNISKIITKGLDISVLNLDPWAARTYQTAVGGQVYELMRRNEFSADIIAGFVVEGMENMQRGFTVLKEKSRRNPNFTNVSLSTTTSYLSSKYRTLQNYLVSNWFGKNYGKISDPSVRSRLLQLRSEAITANKQTYLDEAAELSPILAVQKGYKLLKRNWDSAWNIAKSDIYVRHVAAQSEAAKYWAHKRWEQNDDKNWNENLTEISSVTDESIAHQKETERETFNAAALAAITNPTSETSPAWQQFESWLVSAPAADVSFVQSQINQIKMLTTDLDNLRLQSPTTWSEENNLALTIVALEDKKNQALNQIYEMRAKWLMSPTQWSQINEINIKQSLASTQLEVESDPVSEWVKTQELNRNFYQKYEISNREEYLAGAITDLESKIDDLVASGESFAYRYNGIRWTHLNHLKRDLVTLQSGEIPQRYWSFSPFRGEYDFGKFIPTTNSQELRELYYHYATASDQESRDYWLGLVQAKETEVFDQRLSEWDAENLETMSDVFTAEQISEYQSLIYGTENHAAALEVMQSQEAARKLSFVDQIQSLNHAPNNSGIQALSFSESDLQEVSNTVIPNHLREVLYESFRRFQGDEAKFTTEAIRLAAQASENEERELIAQNNIPKAPVETHYVVQFPHAQSDLNTWNQAVADLQQDIITQQDIFDHLNENLPSLERSMTVARQVYGLNSQEYLQRKDLYAATAHNAQVAQNKINGYQSKITRYQKDISDLERVYDDMKAEYDRYQIDHVAYERNHAPILADIRSQLATKYDVSSYTSAYFASAEVLVTETDDYIPTDPDLVELVDVAPDNFDTVDFDLHWQELESELVAFNPAFQNAKEVTESAKSVIDQNTWDASSDAVIETLNPLLQTAAKKLVNQVQSELGIQLRVSSGFRTRDEQAGLYAQGREDAGEIVTHARAGESYHNYGQAIDIAPLSDDLQTTNYDLTTEQWSRIGEIGKSLGFEWGGDWDGFTDKPHFQMTLGKTIAQLQEQHEAGLLVDGSYFDPRVESEADIRLAIIDNIKNNRDPYTVQLASTGNFGLARAHQLRNYGENNPEWVLAMQQSYGELQASENNDENRWEDETWVLQMVENIKLGKVDFLSFINSPKEEKLALLTAAKKEHKWWKVLSGENKNLGEFVSAMEDHLEIESVKLFFFSALNQSALMVVPALVETLSLIASQALVTPRIALQFKTVLENVIAFSAGGELTESQHKDLANSVKALGLQIANSSLSQSSLDAAIGNWHFEERIAKNVGLPSYEEITDNNNSKSQGWYEVELNQSLLHDNFDYYREIKYVHEDGYEVVYDGETHEIITDSGLMGTYNYGPLLPSDSNLYRDNQRSHSYDYLMHSLLDVFPYYALGGNVR